DSAVGGYSRIGQRREFLPLQLRFDADEVSMRHGNELGVAAGWTKPRPAAMFTNLFIADPAFAARSVAPACSDNHLIPDSQLRRRGHTIANRFHQTSYLMPRRYREFQV